MKIAFFDTKPYDVSAFRRYSEERGISIKFYETKLNEDTVELAVGADATGGCQVVGHRVEAEQVLGVDLDQPRQPLAERAPAHAQTPVRGQVLLVVELKLLFKLLLSVLSKVFNGLKVVFLP